LFFVELATFLCIKDVMALMKFPTTIGFVTIVVLFTCAEAL